jgi:hypothetical protein
MHESLIHYTYYFVQHVGVRRKQHSLQAAAELQEVELMKDDMHACVAHEAILSQDRCEDAQVEGPAHGDRFHGRC